ncbi:hypothetical protein PVAP13_4KG206930 [Panicum virgatum]|uniref:Uncharacterized protein n=1 Tax=Panicum virgatum TaxID=38727 RepID=A0A8T0TKE1_PANVG|nr:hypothetical protein PVAP13_4KG206930 [Panicum virgatum]
MACDHGVRKLEARRLQRHRSVWWRLRRVHRRGRPARCHQPVRRGKAEDVRRRRCGLALVADEARSPMGGALGGHLPWCRCPPPPPPPPRARLTPWPSIHGTDSGVESAPRCGPPRCRSPAA